LLNLPPAQGALENCYRCYLREREKERERERERQRETGKISYYHEQMQQKQSFVLRPFPIINQLLSNLKRVLYITCPRPHPQYMMITTIYANYNLVEVMLVRKQNMQSLLETVAPCYTGLSVIDGGMNGGSLDCSHVCLCMCVWFVFLSALDRQHRPPPVSISSRRVSVINGTRLCRPTDTRK
jgi:hypothetical protein